MNKKEVIGYLMISTGCELMKLGLTEDNGEYLAIGGWKNIRSALQYAVLADDEHNYYYNKTNRIYEGPQNVDIAIKVKGINSDYVIKKKEIAKFIQTTQLLQQKKTDEK